MANKSIPFTLDTQEGYREGGWIYNLNNNKNDAARDSLGMGSLSDYPAFEQMQESLRSMVINATVRNKPVSLDFDPRNCQTDNGSLNCTQACLDGKFLFKPTNLRPCVMLAAAALLQKNGTINLDFSDTETAETIKALNIPDFETFPAAGVLRNVTRCLSSSCAATNLGNCSERMFNLGSFPVNVSRLHTISDIFGDYCKRMNPEINGDIAGPGVVLSYFFQAILALFFYFIVNICTTWTQRYCYAVGGCIKSSLRARAKRLQSRLATSRFGAATASSLAEFQEVQIYLVGSIQVATLISFSSKNTSTGLENNSSFAAAIINARVAPSLSIMSVAPVLLIQCCLQRNGMHWWYTFLTMTAVFIMALAIFAKRDHLLPDADSLWLSFKGQVQLATCGENPSPMVLCRAKKSHYPFENSTLYFAGWLVSSFGSLAWGGLLLDQVVTSLKTRFPNFYSDMVRKRLSRFEGRRSRAFFRRFVQGYWFVIEVMLIVYTIMYLNLLVMIVPNSDMSDSAKWGFGQLIAVLVWTPTIAKYIYFNAFGIKEGFEERLAKSYSITKKPDETPEQEVDAKTGGDDESGLLGSEEPEMARRTW